MHNNTKQKHADFRALFLAGLLTLGCAGCTDKKENKKTDTDTVIADTMYTDNIEQAQEMNPNSNQDIAKTAIEFGEELLAEGKNLTIESAEKKIAEFLYKNGLSSFVKIDDIKNQTNERLAMRQASAAFIYYPDYYLDFEYGTMYIDRSLDLDDDIARTIFINEAVHELTHVLQVQNDRTKQGLYGIVDNLYDAQPVFDFVNSQIIKYPKLQYALNIATDGAASYYMRNNFDEEEINKMLEMEEQYGTYIYNEPVILDENVIKEGVLYFARGGAGVYKKTFEDTVNYFVDYALDSFAKNIKQKEPDKQTLKKALLAHIISIYKNEAQAYETENAIYKKSIGMEENQSTLYDYTPATYRMIVDLLEKKTEKEFG